MERDKTHAEHIERWAKYVRENPDKWKAKTKDFYDAQIIMARRFYKTLAETPEGREKLKAIIEMRKNKK